MGRSVLVIAAVLMLSTIGFFSFTDRSDGLEDGVSFMTMYSTEDLQLTPLSVNSSIMNFTREDRLSNLPMIPFQWYELGEWESPFVDGRLYDMGSIEGTTTAWITLSCPEEKNMDLRATFYIDFNPAMDPIVLQGEAVGPSSSTFIVEFDTDGLSIEELLMFSIKWEMRNGHDDVVIHIGNEDGTGVSTYIEPLKVYSITYWKYFGLSVQLENPFESYEDWDFDFMMSVDDGPLISVEGFYSISGGDEYYYLSYRDFEGIPGEHSFRWEADYGVNSHSSGYYEFVMEEEEPPAGDDDEEPPVGDDDDVEPPAGDDDEEPQGLLTEAQCRRTYTDAVGDDLYFWEQDGKAGVTQGDNSNVDITKVEVKREGDDLVITIYMSGIINEEDTDITAYILPDGGHRQPSIDTTPRSSYDFPDYVPADVVASSRFKLFKDYWNAETTIDEMRCTIRGSLEELMNDGLTEEFEVFVSVDLDDWELSFLEPGGIVDSKMVDYAGSGAWIVVDVEERPRDTGWGVKPWMFIVPIAMILVSVLFLVILVAYVVIRQKKKDLLKSIDV